MGHGGPGLFMRMLEDPNFGSARPMVGWRDHYYHDDSHCYYLRAYAMPPSYRGGFERVRAGRSWSKEAEASHVGSS